MVVVPLQASALDAILAGFGLLVLLGGRRETIRSLRGDGRDERFRQIHVQATAIAGPAVITAIIVAFFVELARAPYSRRGTPGVRSA